MSRPRAPIRPEGSRRNIRRSRIRGLDKPGLPRVHIMYGGAGIISSLLMCRLTESIRRAWANPSRRYRLRSTHPKPKTQAHIIVISMRLCGDTQASNCTRTGSQFQTSSVPERRATSRLPSAPTGASYASEWWESSLRVRNISGSSDDMSSAPVTITRPTGKNKPVSATAVERWDCFAARFAALVPALSPDDAPTGISAPAHTRYQDTSHQLGAAGSRFAWLHLTGTTRSGPRRLGPAGWVGR
jgi:hypothetical protein